MHLNSSFAKEKALPVAFKIQVKWVRWWGSPRRSSWSRAAYRLPDLPLGSASPQGSPSLPAFASRWGGLGGPGLTGVLCGVCIVLCPALARCQDPSEEAQEDPLPVWAEGLHSKRPQQPRASPEGDGIAPFFPDPAWCDSHGLPHWDFITLLRDVPFCSWMRIARS